MSMWVKINPHSSMLKYFFEIYGYFLTLCFDF
jgi:hypothetical protein